MPWQGIAFFTTNVIFHGLSKENWEHSWEYVGLLLYRKQTYVGTAHLLNIFQSRLQKKSLKLHSKQGKDATRVNFLLPTALRQ